MKNKIYFFVLLLFTFPLTSLLQSEPSFNGPTPGCSGSGCHSFSGGDVSATILNNFQVQVTVSGTSSKVGGELVDEYGNVVAVINSTSTNPFILTAPSTGSFTVNAGYDNPSKRWDSASVVISVASNDSLFFAQGSEWKYLDDGSDQDTVWQELAFDDSQWSVGHGHMGYGEGDETTLLEPGHITYYFRKIVSVPDTSLLDSIYFNIVHDDGAVAYVNGTEVLRSALMPPGPINYLTRTTTFIPNDLENDFWTYKVDKSDFQNGDNIIAIEVHNHTTSSSDISFDCYVSDTYVVEYQTDGPYVFYRNGEIVVKTIESTGPQTYTYQNPEEVVLTCRFPNGIDSFNVALQNELTIEPSMYTLPDKFFAISDMEGRIEEFVMVLQDAGVIDDNYNWIFDAGHLFFVGDMFDRGKNVTECLWLLYRLETQAQADGGKIHFIIGNHDIMNLIYDFRYVAQKYIVNAQLMGETLESVYALDTELGRWLRTKNLIEKVEPIIFVHGGISPGVDALNLSYDEINYWGRYRMDSICTTNPCAVVNGGSAVGIYWYRGMANEDLTQQQVDTILSHFGGDMVVIGHTIFDDITLLYNEKVICIDLDHEYNFTNGYMRALFYEDGNLYNFYTNGTTQTYTLLRTVSEIEEETELLPNKFLLNQNYPNPFNPSTIIKYEIPERSFVTLRVYDVLGKEITTLVNEETPGGTYQVDFDTYDLTSGIYFYQLQAGSFVGTRKMVLLK